MGDIFISYARKELDKVRPLAEALEACGWDVWWDPQIRSGIRFDRLIEKGLEKARSILVVWSQYSVDSDWVRDEATEGLEQNILVAITTDPNLKLPLRFRYIHTELLVEWDRKKHSPAYDKIVRDLEEILGCPDVSQKSADKKKEHPDFDAMVEIPAGEFISQNDTAIIETPFMIVQIGIETPTRFIYCKESGVISRFNTVKQLKGNLLHLPDKKFEVLPGAWVSIYIFRLIHAVLLKGLPHGDEVFGRNIGLDIVNGIEYVAAAGR